MESWTRDDPAADFDGLFPAELFRALADDNRIALLCRLATACSPQSVTDAAGCCPTDISVVSRHLAILRDAGILEARKKGRNVYYSVRYGELSRALREMAEAIDSCCPGGRAVSDSSTTSEKENTR